MESTEELIARADIAYDQGNPIMTDEEYDNLTASLGIEQSLRGEDIEPERKIAHEHPMLSLDKVRTEQAVESWLKSVVQATGPLMSDEVPVSVEYKYDGFALSAVYHDGLLSHVVTRGNGSVGENVTQNARFLFPAELKQFRAGTIEIRGEAVMPKESLKRLENYGIFYSNTRNGVPGLIRRKDDVSHVVKQVAQFIAYDVIGEDYALVSEMVGDSQITWSRTQGEGDHRTQLNLDLTKMDSSVEMVMDEIRAIEAAQGSLPFDIDGAVIKVLDGQIRRNMGATSHHPRWAVAFKYKEVSKTTAIRQVTWHRGRTGRVVPVAHFDAVDLGSNVTQATLHNLSIFRQFTLHEGDTITLKRSGEVIPYIMAAEHTGEGEAFPEPEQCPDCLEALTTKGEDLFCANKDCGLDSRIVNALQVMDLKGISYGLINKLLAPGEYLSTATDIVDALDRLLTMESEKLPTIAHLDGEGDISQENAIQVLAGMRNVSLVGWLASLGISGIAYSTAQKLIFHFRDLESLDPEQVRGGAIKGLGDFAATQVETHLDLIDRLAWMLVKHGVEQWFHNPAEDADEDSEFYGKNIVVTGSFGDVKRPQIEGWLIDQGANIQGSVSKTTDILFAGERAGSKLAKAQSLGSVDIRSELPF